MSRVRFIAVLPLALGFAQFAGACGSGGAASPPATTVPATSEVTTTVPSPAPGTAGGTATTRSAGPTTTAAASGAPAARRALVLTGVSIGDFSFGAPAEATVTGLSKELGKANRGPGESCPGFTYASWDEAGVSVLFDSETHLAGWWVRKPDVAATREDVEVGDSLGDLRKQFGPGFTMEENSSVGPMFIISPDPRSDEEYYGTADADGDAGRVDGLYAGRHCMAE